MSIWNNKLDKYRVASGPFKTAHGDQFGLFFIPVPGKPSQTPLKVLCAPMDSEWQHVSVSLPNRCPNWREMQFIKIMFWGENVTCVQFHPKKSEYVNNHPYCLHLWRRKGQEYELPPSNLVGVKDFKNENE